MVLFLQLSLSSCVVRKLVQVTPACITLTDYNGTCLTVAMANSATTPSLLQSPESLNLCGGCCKGS